MHTKTWILDEATVLTGSVNLSHGGLENNKEHLYEIRDPQVVKEVLEDFEETWQGAEIVEQSHIEIMQRTSQLREQKKKTNTGYGRSRSFPSLDEEGSAP